MMLIHLAQRMKASRRIFLDKAARRLRPTPIYLQLGSGPEAKVRVVPAIVLKSFPLAHSPAGDRIMSRP